MNCSFKEIQLSGFKFIFLIHPLIVSGLMLGRLFKITDFSLDNGYMWNLIPALIKIP